MKKVPVCGWHKSLTIPLNFRSLVSGLFSNLRVAYFGQYPLPIRVMPIPGWFSINDVQVRISHYLDVHEQRPHQRRPAGTAARKCGSGCPSGRSQGKTPAPTAASPAAQKATVPPGAGDARARRNRAKRPKTTRSPRSSRRCPDYSTPTGIGHYD
jgi:hypothetical protein